MQSIKTFGPPASAERLRVTDKLLPIDTYKDRLGYDPAFLGAVDPLPLPGSKAWAADLVALKPAAAVPGNDKHEIKYTHFSVKMAASRSLPLFSACNIDGKLSDRDIERTDVWRRDPRIENRYQNLREAYGNENQGLFSRGHMTRREDPNWGEKKTAQQADVDTFHVSNVAPQRQGFNAGVWLDLENYVLDNTDENDLKVTVITGPVLLEDDPVYYGIKIPTEFWKIVAFVHGRTKRLTTIAYKRAQLDFLPKRQRTRFVFGNFDDTQVSIASLQLDTGLDLSSYIPFDVLEGAGMGLEVRLASVSDAYLVR